jgi:hypothetical protein
MKKLVGEGKPFHSAVDKTAALLKRKVGTGAEFMKELMGVSGIKPTEIQERGLNEVMGMPRMTHDQFMANLSIRPAPAIQEKVLGGDRSELDSEAPYHGKWTLPGGDNYREMLIKAPKGVDNQEKIMELEAKLRRAPNTNNEEQDQWNKLYNQIRDLRAQEAASPEPFKGVSGHFGGEPGILASMRLKDRIVPGDMGYTLVNKKSGNKSQHYATAEEAQAAMQNMPESMRPMLSIQQSRGPDKKLLHLEELQSDWHQEGRDKGYTTLTPKELEELRALTKKEVEEDGLLSHDMARSRELEAKIGEVPNAPFKKNWEEMALKRLIHHAAEKGYHGVVMTPGEEQAKRYNIGDRIGYLGYHPEEERLKAYDHDRREVMNQTGIKKEDLPSHIGKEVADRLLKAPQVLGTHQIEGEDIHVGGEGMKGFYDKKVPNILNSIGKKYGVKTQLGGHRLQGSPEDYSNAVEKLGIAHIPMAQLTPEQNQKIAETADKRLHHFPITEEMRKDVLTNGLPLYNKGGTVHMADGGDMDQMQLEMINKKTKKPTVEQIKQAIFAKAQQGLMKPSEVLGKHEGKYLHMTEADRAKVEKRKHGMRGGVGFTQIGLEDPEYAGRTWGVGKASVAAKLLRRQRKGLTPEEQSIWTTFIGTPEMHTSNQLVFNRMWNKFQEAKKTGLLDPEQEAKMLDIMRSAMTKGTAKKPPKAIFEPDASFDNTHHLFDTFERRRILADLMSGKRVGGKKGQIFDASKMIEDTTDPRLLHAPTLSVGPHVFSFDDKISYEPHLNKAFPYMLHGETSPDAFTQLPFTVAAPDFAQQIRQSKGREPGYMDIVRGIPRQQLTEKYLTALQKQGYNRGGGVRMADGGQVDVQKIGVNEAPNMDVKQFFAPRPAQGNMLPVGGVQQPPQAQQAPMQPPPPAPNQPPQQPSPAPMQAGQPPSNILQMTRQGQAMNAMTPPQMARGGQVTLDDMMLALMNRNKKVKYG